MPGEFEANAGYLRPEGFQCAVCYAKRCEDPAYVVAMERDLPGLVNMPREDEAGAAAPAVLDLDLASPASRRAWESLVGLAVGDALGAPREGAPFDAEAAVPVVGLGSPPLPWTDDTQMALSIVQTLVELRAIDRDRLARLFADRFQPWRGYGPGARLVLGELRRGKAWRDLRDSVFPGGSFGNGSAMRVAPLGAYLAQEAADRVVCEAARSAEVTHAHPEGIAGAAAVALAAWHASRSRGRPAPRPAELMNAVSALLAPDLAVTRGLHAAAALPAGLDAVQAVAVLGNGSRVACQDTVPLAVWIACRHLDDFRSAVELAVRCGGDTDTVAAIAGGIVAARVGVEGIPLEWRQGVEPLPIRPCTPAHRPGRPKGIA